MLKSFNTTVDTPRKIRAELAFQGVCYRRRIQYERLLHRVKTFFGWYERDIDALIFEQLAVIGQRSRILLKILLGRELQTVYKNAHYRAVRFLLRGSDER